MKKLFLFISCCLSALCTFAQGDIQFHVLKSAQTDLSASVAESLDLRLKQILNRNSAATADAYNVFAIEPVIEMGDVVSTEGMVQNVSVAKGELTLLAKNAVDGMMYYSVVVPLKGDATGDKEKAMKTMVANLKVTDPVFTRFIRTARQKIQDYYAANCAVILQQAQSLYEQGKYGEAMSYLSAISVSVPCYEQASVLLAELAKLQPQAPDTVVIERVVERPVEVEKVVEVPVEVEKIVEVPVEVERIVEVPVVVEKPVIVERPVEQPVAAPEELDCEISISTQDLRFKVLKCFGDVVQKRITIVGQFTNVTNDNWKSVRVEFRSAFTANGVELKDKTPQDYWQNFPTKVPTPREFYVTKLTEKVKRFSFVELYVNGTTIEIRNLPVEWE